MSQPCSSCVSGAVAPRVAASLSADEHVSQCSLPLPPPPRNACHAAPFHGCDGARYHRMSDAYGRSYDQQ